MTTNNTNEEQPGHTVTVFGATGQLGRYIVNRLGEPTLYWILIVGDEQLKY
jgi:hypothetical protein